MINCTFTYCEYDHRQYCCHDIAFRYCTFQIFLFPCSIILRYKNRKTLCDTCHNPQHQPYQPISGTYCRQCLNSYHLSDDHGVCHCIKLLKNISKHHWYGKSYDQFSGRSGSHIFFIGSHKNLLFFSSLSAILQGTLTKHKPIFSQSFSHIFGSYYIFIIIIFNGSSLPRLS